MKRICVAAALSLLGCGGRDEDNLDFMAEVREAGGHGANPSALSNAKGVAGLFVLEDPTLDPNLDQSQNLDRVVMQAAASTASCAGARVTREPDLISVTIDFGSGCTLPIGTVSGAVTAGVLKYYVRGGGSFLNVSFLFTNLTINELALSGGLSASTTNGTTFNFEADLMQGSKQLEFGGTIEADAGGKGVTVDGVGMSDESSYTIAGLHHSFGSCYADAGTFALASTTRTLTGKTVMVTKTMTFSSTTPSTGKVTVTLSGRSYEVNLPPYGSCPK